MRDYAPGAKFREEEVKRPRIIDADEAVGDCDMNYDYELVGYQAARNYYHPECFESYPIPSQHYGYKRNESPVQLEKQAKEFIKKGLDSMP